MLKAALLIDKRQLWSNTLMFIHAKAFENVGLKIDVFDIEDDLVKLGQYVAEKPLFFFSCDAVGAGMTCSGVSLFTFLQTPLITLIFDTMDCSASAGIGDIDSGYIHYKLYDAADACYIEKYLPAIKNYSLGKPCGFLAAGQRIPIKNRVNEISFCGNVLNEQQQRADFDKIEVNGIPCAKLYDEVVDYLMNSERDTTREGVEKVFAAHDIEFSANTEKQFHLLVRKCMLSVRSKRRCIILQSLAKNGFKVNVYGFEGSFDSVRHKNIVYGGALMFDEDLMNMTKTKVIINTNSLTKAAINRRQLCAMMNGAVVLTDTNEEIDQHFVDNKHIAVFYNKKLSDVPCIVGNLLENPDKMQEIANNAVEITTQQFNSMYQTQQMLDAAVNWHHLAK